jgi:hypothetical protein
VLRNEHKNIQKLTRHFAILPKLHSHILEDCYRRACPLTSKGMGKQKLRIILLDKFADAPVGEGKPIRTTALKCLPASQLTNAE